MSRDWRIALALALALASATRVFGSLPLANVCGGPLGIIAGEISETTVPLEVTGHWTARLVTRKYNLGDLSVEVNRVDLTPGEGEEFQQWLKSTFGSTGPVAPLLARYGNKPGSYSSDPLIQARQAAREEWSQRHRENRDRWKSIIDENVDFAVSQYPRRGWSENFFSELKELAHHYGDQSSYVTVRNASGKIVGTARSISNRNSLSLGYDKSSEKQGGVWSRLVVPAERQHLFPWATLPMEDALRINLERPVLTLPRADGAAHPQLGNVLLGEVVELGNFAIDRHLNAEVYRAVALELLAEVFNPENSADYNSLGKLLYTYADEEGKRLYRPMGFEVVDGSHGIEHAGRKWWVLRSTPAELSKHLLRLKARDKLGKEDAEAFQKLAEALMRSSQISAKLEVQDKDRTRHGVSDPIGYSESAAIERERRQAREAVEREFDAEWKTLCDRPDLAPLVRGKSAEDLARPYRELLTRVRDEELRGEPIHPADLASAFMVQRENNIPVRITIYDVHTAGRTGEIAPHPFLTPRTMEARDGALWETKMWFRLRILHDRDIYRPDQYMSDLRRAALEELETRLREGTPPLTHEEMNRRLLHRLWEKVHRRFRW